MESKTLYLKTFGCQMNESDSERIIGILHGLGYNHIEDEGKADLIIINTCSIREKAEQKVYSTLGRFKNLKIKNDKLILGVGGCVAQQEGERLLRRVPYLDIVFGTHSIHLLPGIIKEIENNRSKVCETSLFDSIELEESFLSAKVTRKVDFESPFNRRVKAYVTIMRGCENFCSYCIVPHLRGKEVSRRSKDIIKEIENLRDEGVKEITLLGQNVNSYGMKSADEVTFHILLRKIAEIKGIDRIRFTTSHPKDLSHELIRFFLDLEKLCDHIHLPIQSGSNNILKMMNRQYTKEAYLEKVSALRALKPDIGLTTDIIVGFPGETEKDFEETMDILKVIEFDGIYSFRFSPRPGTPAADFQDQVPEETKLKRLKALQELQREITQKKNKAMVGTVNTILVEGWSKRNLSELTGRTSCNKVVNFKGDVGLIGKTIPVRIENAFTNSLRGTCNLKLL